MVVNQIGTNNWEFISLYITIRHWIKIDKTFISSSNENKIEIPKKKNANRLLIPSCLWLWYCKISFVIVKKLTFLEPALLNTETLVCIFWDKSLHFQPTASPCRTFLQSMIWLSNECPNSSLSQLVNKSNSPMY